MSYTEVLFKAYDDMYINLHFGRKNTWDWNGYAFPFNGMRFGDKWYVEKSRDSYLKLNYQLYDIKDVVQIFKSSPHCWRAKHNR